MINELHNEIEKFKIKKKRASKFWLDQTLDIFKIPN